MKYWSSCAPFTLSRVTAAYPNESPLIWNYILIYFFLECVKHSSVKVGVLVSLKHVDLYMHPWAKDIDLVSLKFNSSISFPPPLHFLFLLLLLLLLLFLLLHLLPFLLLLLLLLLFLHLHHHRVAVILLLLLPLHFLTASVIFIELLVLLFLFKPLFIISINFFFFFSVFY